MASQRPLFDPSRIGGPAEPAAPRMMTVTQLNLLVKRVLGDHLPGTIHLVGQISNYTRHTSGHVYLTLKDDRSEVRAVMWKSAAASLKFQPSDGMEVVATGSVDVFESRGQVQFYIRSLEPRGVGALELAFRQLREKLSREGLFDPDRKKPLPPFPSRIAVVTSPTGAAIRDILRTIERRFPCASVLLYPVRVQGEGAAQEIASALGRLNQHSESLGGIDVIILARGGGSIEDLWSFNEEIVARAIFASRIPIVSGVGHEVDVTIADLVADVRAATPTAAAELAAPVLGEVLDDLASHAMRLSRGLRHLLDLSASRLEAAGRFELFRDPVGMVHRSQQRVDECGSRLRLVLTRRFTDARNRLHRAELTLRMAQPADVLRGRHNQAERSASRLQMAIIQRFGGAHQRLERSRLSLEMASPRRHLETGRTRLTDLAQQLAREMAHLTNVARQRLESLCARLELNEHRKMLARGFTITRTAGGRIVTSPADVGPGDKIITQTASGDIESRVTDSRQPELFD